MKHPLEAAISAVPKVKDHGQNKPDISKLILAKYEELVKDALRSGTQHIKNTTTAIGTSSLIHRLRILFEKATQSARKR